MAKVKEEHFGIARKIVSNMTSESWETIPHATLTSKQMLQNFLRSVKS